MTSFSRLAGALRDAEVRFVLIGVAGANLYARAPSDVFTTLDRDLFLPPDPDNLLAAWRTCEASSLFLTCSREPLDQPRDRWLAQQVVQRRALTRAEDERDLTVDLTLVMAGFEFEDVWRERRSFHVDGVPVPVARLAHIVRSKSLAGRPKDHLFLATHEEALRDLLAEEGPAGPS